MVLQIQRVTLLGISYPPHCSDNVYPQTYLTGSQPILGTQVHTVSSPVHGLTATHTHTHVLMLLPCSLVSSGTDELLPVRALKLLQVPTETCAFPLSHVLWSVHTRQYTRGLHTGNSLREPAFHSHTRTPGYPIYTDLDTLQSHTHTRHTRPSLHTPLHTQAHPTQTSVNAWGENVSQQGAEASTKPQSPASPPGVAAQSAAPAQLQGQSPPQAQPSQEDSSGGEGHSGEKTALNSPQCVG